MRDHTGKYVFDPAQSTTTEDWVGSKFAFGDDAEVLRAIGDALRTPVLVGPPEVQAARRTFVEPLEDSPEKRGALGTSQSIGTPDSNLS